MRKRTKKSIVAAAGLTTALTGLVAVHHAEPLGVLGGGGQNRALAAEGRELSDEARITIGEPVAHANTAEGRVYWDNQSISVDLTGVRVENGDKLTLKFGPNVNHWFEGMNKGTPIRLKDGTVIGTVTAVEQTDNHSTAEKRLELSSSAGWNNTTVDQLSRTSEWVVTFNEEAAKRDSIQFGFSGTSSFADSFINSTKDYTVKFEVRTKSGKLLVSKSQLLGKKTVTERVFNTSVINRNPNSPFFNSRIIPPANYRPEAGSRFVIRYDKNSHFGLDKASLIKLKEQVGKKTIRHKGPAIPHKLENSSNVDGLYKAVMIDNEYRLVDVDVENQSVTWEVVKFTNDPEANQFGLAPFTDTNDVWIRKDDGVTPINLLDTDDFYENGTARETFVTSYFLTKEGVKENEQRTPLVFFFRGFNASASGETVKQSVTVRFVDSKTGQELKTQKLYKPFRNDPFTTPPEDLVIEGKTLINPNDSRIERVSGDATITLRYEEAVQNSNVNVLVVDEAGKTIKPNSTVFTEAKPEGTEYRVRKPRIAGYRFVRAEGELAGTLGKTDKTVKLVYKADSSVVAGTDPDSIEERRESVVPIPFETETRDNPELWAGEERVINPGAEGSKTVITTRQLDENQQPIGDPVVTENVTKEPVKRVIERGTKNPAGTETMTAEKPKPFKTETRDNPDLYEGDERVVTEGKDGVTTVTTVYKTNKGKRTGDNPTVTETEKQPPVNRIVERGTKDPNGIDTVKEHEDVVYKTEYRDNPELYEGETRVIQEGELGSNLITKQYKTKKGKRTDEEPVVTKTTEKEPKNRIIERGTKPVAGVDTIVEDKELPFKLVVKDNPELTEGEERVVTEGTPGLVKKTTAYKTEKGKRVGDPTVTETVVKEPIDRVVEKGTKPKTPKQTDADKNNPKGKDQTVFVGEKPDPKASVENYNDLPEGTVVKWEKDPDTATPGQKPSILLFEYPDGSVERVSVIVTAVPKPEPKDQTVFVGENPRAEDSIGNYPQLPEGTRVSWLVPPKTDKPGVVDGVVLIEYPDGRRIELPVRVTVVEKEKEKEKQPPQKQENNNGENGNNKDKVSDNSDYSDKDSKKDKPTPQGKNQTVKVGENPLVQDSIINHNELPKGTKLSWEKTPDTTKPGVIEAVVLVEYPDGTSEKVVVRINVVDDSDKGKEKDNHENSNKTNANDNKTPEKKEQSQNKQPDRKESIKTGVGSVDQTAAGVALTATALALSAFALRRRKQQ